MKVSSSSKSSSASSLKLKLQRQTETAEEPISIKLSCKQNLYIKKNLAKILSGQTFHVPDFLKTDSSFSLGDESCENSNERNVDFFKTDNIHHLESVLDLNIRSLNEQLATLEKEKHKMFKTLKEILLQKPRPMQNADASVQNEGSVKLNSDVTTPVNCVGTNKQSEVIPDGNLSPVSSIESCDVYENRKAEFKAQATRTYPPYPNENFSRSREYPPAHSFPKPISASYSRNKDKGSNNQYFYSDKYRNVYYNGEPNRRRNYSYDYVHDFEYPEYHRPHKKPAYFGDNGAYPNDYERYKYERSDRPPQYHPPKFYK